MWVDPSPMPRALRAARPSSTPGIKRGWYMSRTVMMTGLIHSWERISMGFGRYAAMFSYAGTPPMETVSKVNSSPSMYSSQLASVT